MTTQRSWTLRSPDERLAIIVTQRATDRALCYAIEYDGAAVIAATDIGLATDAADFSRALEFLGSTSQRIDERYRLPTGKQAEYRNHARELTLRFAQGEQAIELVVRAYDDAAAYRFAIPTGAGALSIRAEHGGHRLLPGSRGWAAEHAADYERPWEARSDHALDAGVWQYPVLIQTPDSVWALLTEACVYSSYSASHARGGGPGSSMLRLEPAGLPVETSHPFATPWRVTLVGRELARIVESCVIENLNPASELADTSWVKPGRAAWSWWSGDSTSDYATQVRYVDFAAAMGWEYYVCDEGWQDAWMPALVAYARSKNIGIWLWCDSKHLSSDRDLSEQMARWAGWGVIGVKADFISGDSIHALAVQDNIARTAAKQRLMVNFHGCTKPTGERRRWPHLVTREAVYGAEHYKFGGGPSARFNCIVPFTRNVQGPMDYTPVTYSRCPADTTLAHQTALAVVFESGVQHMADRPSVYEQSIARDFLRACPAAWDETKLLEGAPGCHVTIARRAGAAWYIGSLAADTPRTALIPLDFLGPGAFAADIYRDGDTDAVQVHERVALSHTTKLQIAIRELGGCAIRIAPR